MKNEQQVKKIIKQKKVKEKKALKKNNWKEVELKWKDANSNWWLCKKKYYIYQGYCECKNIQERVQ